MKVKMKHKILSMFLAATLVTSAICSNFTFVSATDSPPMVGTQAFKPNQPGFNGYRIWDIRDWTPEEDQGAEFLRAEVPLQERIAPFKPTQANPTLESQAEIMLMQGDYGNAFVDGMMYNNTFSYNTLNYWQYVDYFSPWHGAATATSPKDLYDWNLEETDPNGWQKRYFEFGVLNIPNPAYTNAAHKNGAKSIACIYFDQAFRQGQTINELFIQDEDGKFPVAEKLIEMAEYFGYDGYFFNAEESVDPKFADSKKKFLARLTEVGLWTQYYDTNSYMNESKASWLAHDINGDGKKEKIQDSVFVNYGWPGSLNNANMNFDYITKNNIDPFKQVFYGVEAKQGEFKGGHPTALKVSELYAEGTKNLRASVALFTPSDFYQRDLPGNIKKDKDEKNGAILNDDAHQWMIAERERMYFSGVKSDPTNTGHQEGFKRPEIGVEDASKWVGVADFASERSVINGSNFYTNFNVGKGMQYFNNGEVSRDEQWSNITIQDILPSWQWWITSKTDNKLKADFDFGTKYETKATEFEKVGAYNGGSSLVVTGNLDSENLLRLYKTDLSVNDKSKVDITYFKPTNDDASEIKLALIFKDSPEKVEYIAVPNTGLKTSSWEKATIDLSKYAGEEIATIALAFNPTDGAVANYQMNIGEIKVDDSSITKPEKPTNFKVDRMFTDDEAIVTWDLASFDKVDKYEIFATLSNGKKINVGSNYDNIYYIKSLLNEKDAVKLELIAIGKDGSRSESAVIDFDYKNKVSNIKVESVKKLVKTIPDTKVIGSVTQAKDLGLLDISWSNPTTDYKELEITVSMDDSKDKTTFTKKVAKGVNLTTIDVPRGHGEKYNVAIKTVLNDDTKTDAINTTGNVQDVYVAPYDPNKVMINGTSATFWCPDPNDWFKVHATFNGKPLNFTSRFAGTQSKAIRATTYMKATLPSATGILSVVVEDYSGNFSEPTVIVCGGSSNTAVTLDEKTFPDVVLLSAVKAKANDVKELKNIKELDLSGSEVANLTGLTALSNLEKINIKGCTKLEIIGTATFPNSLKEINVSGCSALKVLSLNNTSLEKIVCEDPTQLTEIVLVDMSNSKFDMSQGTPERAFADAMGEQTKGKNSIVKESSIKTNIASNAKITCSKNVNNLFDGDFSNYAHLPAGTVINIETENPVKVTSLKVSNYSAVYGLKAFDVEYSTDNTEWKPLIEPVNDNALATYSKDIENVSEAKYYRFVAKEGLSSGPYLKEIELIGYDKLVYPVGVKFENQKPNAYPKTLTTVVVPQIDKEFNVKSVLSQYVTVRGNDYACLKAEDFADKAYIDSQMKVDNGVFAKVTNSEGKVVSYENINTKNPATYTVQYRTYNVKETEGKDLGTVTLAVSEIKNALISSIEIAEGKDLTQFKKASVEVLKEKLANAIKIRDDVTISDKAVIDNAKSELDAAVAALVARADNKDLVDLYNTNKANVEGSYVAATWPAFKTALDEVKVVIDNSEATAEEIASSFKRLDDAVKALVVRADKTGLQALYDANKDKVEELYTKATWAEFKKALDDAKVELDNVDAAQNDVATVMKKLDETSKTLVVLGNKKDIQDELDVNKNKVESDYTKETWTVFKKALDDAKAFLQKEELTETEVKTAIENLDKAVKGLVKVSTGGSTGGSGSVTPTEPSKPTNPTSPTETVAVYHDATNVMAVVPAGIKNVSKPRLEVKKLANNSQEVAKLIKAAKDYKLLGQYEIDLYDGTTKITQVEGGKIRVSIPYADIKANTTYVVLRLNDNGTVTELQATVKDGRIEFETDHFSTYAIAVKNSVAEKPTTPAKPSTKPTKNPQTGDSNPMLPLAVLVTLLGATTVSGLVVRKKSKQN